MIKSSKNRKFPVQKENLEKTVLLEREEKATLEHNLMVLNKRLQQIESGPEGLRDLSENFKRQAKKFNELRDVLNLFFNLQTNPLL